MNPQPMIVVHSVPSSSAWYQHVLGLKSAHGGEEYEMLVFEERLVLQLHRWEAHEHPHMGDPNSPLRGNGAVLWFQTDDFDAAWQRIQEQAARVVDGPLVNPNARHREVWLRDPDGYLVVIAGARGDVG